MWQIFIHTYWRSHKHCKCSFSLTSGRRNVGNVRSCLLLVVRIVANNRFNLLSVASIKHSVDIMLKYIVIVSKKVFQNTNNRNLFLVEVVTLSQDREECGEARNVSLKRRACNDSTVESL